MFVRHFPLRNFQVVNFQSVRQKTDTVLPLIRLAAAENLAVFADNLTLLPWLHVK